MMRLLEGSTCSVINDLTSFSALPSFMVYSCERENWTEGGFCGEPRSLQARAKQEGMKKGLER